jgi:hypothetical protein
MAGKATVKVGTIVFVVLAHVFALQELPQVCLYSDGIGPEIRGVLADGRRVSFRFGAVLVVRPIVWGAFVAMHALA